MKTRRTFLGMIGAAVALVAAPFKSTANPENPYLHLEDPYDLEAYLEASAEDRLLMLQAAWLKTNDQHTRTFYEGQMMGLTIDIDEHPEGFEHSCLCASCRDAC